MVGMTIRITGHTEGVDLITLFCGLAETYPIVLVIIHYRSMNSMIEASS